MMKRRTVFFVFVFLLIFSLDISASDIIADEAPSVPEEVREYLPSDLFDYSAEELLYVFTLENGVKTLLSIARDVFPDVMSAFLLLMGLCVISAVLAALKESVCSQSLKFVIEFISVLCIASAVFSYVSALFENFRRFTEQATSFMTVIVPVMSALILSSGEISASAVFGSVLSAAVTLLETVCAALFVPLLSALLCVSVTSSVCSEVDISGFSRLIKNIIVYLLSAAMLALTSIMTFQSVIAKSADTAAVKGVKFVLGNAIPLVGGALADAMTTVASSIGIIRAATGVGGAVVICVIFALPVIKMIFWKLMFDAVGAVSSAFALKKESAFFSEISQITGFLIAVMASISMLFIIALTAAAFASGGK